MNSEFEVSVLGGFGFSAGGIRQRELSHGAQRLLAFLALRDRAVVRTSVAGALWPEASEKHAHASLRSELSRLNGIKGTVVRVTFQELALVDEVCLDIREARALAHRLIGATPGPDSDLTPEAIFSLSADLLPDWYDEWAVADAEEWRQLRLHALDALSERLVSAHRYGDATSAALAAVKAEPLRETAHAILIGIYLAEGNRAEARVAFQHYRALLHEELGLEPTSTLQALIRNI